MQIKSIAGTTGRRRFSFGVGAAFLVLAAAVSGVVPDPSLTMSTSATTVDRVGSEYRYIGNDKFFFSSGDGNAVAVGQVKWYEGAGSFGQAIRRGEYEPDGGSGPAATRARSGKGCVWAQVNWNYVTGSVSVPPSGSLGGGSVEGSYQVACSTSSDQRPLPFINLDSAEYAKSTLLSTTLTICTSAKKSDGPGNCGRHKMTRPL